MSSEIELHAANIIPPYRNSTGLASQANVMVGAASQAINLSDYFGGLGDGSFITLEADGAKVYVAIGSNDIGSISEAAVSGNGVCFPIPDGTQLPMRILGGREMGTGYATNVQYASGVILWAKLATGGSSGWLRMYRSSVASTQGIEQLKPKGF